MEAKQRIPFTKQRLQALPVPPDKRVYVYDDKTEGLALCVTPTGTRTFYLVKWFSGNIVRMPLGTFPTISVENARDLCRSALGDMAKGVNPLAKRKGERRAAQQERQGATLADLWTVYLDLHAKPHKKSWQDDERMYKKYMAKLHGKRLSDIDDTAVAKWHAAIAKGHGPIQANRAKALLATMYSKASKHAGYAGPNPCIRVPSYPERLQGAVLAARRDAGVFPRPCGRRTLLAGVFPSLPLHRQPPG